MILVCHFASTEVYDKGIETKRLNCTFHGKKEIRVYDYVDEKVPELERMYKSLKFELN